MVKCKKKEFGLNIFRDSRNIKKTWNNIRECCLGNIDKCVPILYIFLAESGNPNNVDLNFEMPERESEFSFRNISLSDLWKAISSIKSNAVGFDQIPLKFIKLIFPIFGSHFLHLFNTIITTSIFSNEWKIGVIIPLPKNKNPELVSDFRPISILPVLSKVFEVIVMEQLVQRSTIRSKLYPLQSGFRPHHNTTSSTLELTESIRSKMDKKEVSILVSFDFKNGKVNHLKLIEKLYQQYGFNFTACKLLHK